MSDLQSRLQTAVGDTYRIDEELGGGGMSRVFLAEEVRLGRWVVIKVLPPDMAAGVNIERFEREIQLAAKLQHPHVVQLLTAASSEDLLYYVMPFIEGESLRAKLAREGELPVGDAVRILKEVVDALAYAHEHGVVHRDIKPDNVLLSGAHAVVTDFGVAKAVTASTSRTSLTSMGVALGTPAYMSPEQAAANPQIDHRADIYAAGVLAYEMLCGQPPFAGANPESVMAKHVTQQPEPVSKHRTAVSQALNALVMRCLEKKPADRWQRATELVPQLEAMATPSGGVTPTGAVPVATASGEIAIRRNHPARVLGLYTLASIGLLGVIYLLVMQLGLPDWVFPGAATLLLIGLPIAFATGFLERQRALARTTGGLRAETEQGVRSWFTWRMALMSGGVAFAGLVLATAVYMAMRVLGIGPVGTLVASGVLGERDRIILADFENLTTDSTVSETVTELLRIDLAQSPTVTVMEASQVGRVLARMRRNSDTILSLELATEVAEREGLKAVLAGEIRPVGGNQVISVRLLSAGTGDVLVAARETAGADDLIGAVDRLSAKLRERIGESLRTIRADPPLARYTTGSTDALLKYTQANRANNNGEFARAVSLLEAAVADDTTFAMAYRRLGVIIRNTGGDWARATEALTRAYSLRDRLTEREYYHVTAMYLSSVEGDRQAGNDTYRTLLDKYPNDLTALNNLGNASRIEGKWAEAEKLFLRSIALGNDAAVTFQNTIHVQVARGEFDAAHRTLELFGEKHPQNPGVEAYRGALASSRGDFVAAAAHVRNYKAAQTGSIRWQARANGELASLARLHGQLAEAGRLARQADSAMFELAKPPIPLALWSGLGQAEDDLWFRSDAEGVARALDRMLRQYPLLSITADSRPYIQLATLYARAGQPERARSLLGEWEKEMSEQTRGRQEARLHVVLAEIALAEGRPLDAVEELRLVEEDAAGCPVCLMFPLGDAYDRAGQGDSAAALYERYLTTPYLFRLGLDSRLRPATYRRLGELYEERGEQDKAVDNYNRFVELWQDADEEFQPLVQDIKGRIARLVAER